MRIVCTFVSLIKLEWNFNEDIYRFKSVKRSKTNDI